MLRMLCLLCFECNAPQASNDAVHCSAFVYAARAVHVDHAALQLSRLSLLLTHLPCSSHVFFAFGGGGAAPAAPSQWRRGAGGCKSGTSGTSGTSGKSGKGSGKGTATAAAAALAGGDRKSVV